MSAVAMFRCDASPVLGGGHVMRCLAFAETLVWAGWSCVFVTDRTSVETVPALAESSHAIRTIDNGEPLADGERLVVFDGYGLGKNDEKALRAERRAIVVFDDLADRVHDCDVLLDPTPMRRAATYIDLVPPGARLLLGSDMAILFRRWREQRTATTKRLGVAGPLRRILVSMGMTDPLNATSGVIEALKVANIDAAIDVVLGAGAPHKARVREALGPRMTLHIDPPNFVELAARADLAIGAPGTSSFERALLGLPAILVSVAENQRFIADAFATAGAADVLRYALLGESKNFARYISMLAQDGARRADMSRRAASMTDGRGVQRLLLACAGSRRTKDGIRISLRVAERTDEAWLLGLQQQPATRRFAVVSDVPTAAEHSGWLASSLENPDRLLAIIEADGVAAGMLRLDRNVGERTCFEISIALDEARHGQGIGGSSLYLVREIAPTADLIATVLPENRASLALFKRAGYQPDGVNRFCSRAA